jgi:hypothetical protein
MQIFFADDSSQASTRRTLERIISFGGVFVDSEALKSLTKEIDEVARRFELPFWTELKWSPRRADWIHSNLHGAARRDCYCEVLKLARDHGVRALVASWCKGRSSLSAAESFDRILDYTFERIGLHLMQLGTDGLIVSDRPGGGRKDEDDFLKRFFLRTKFGTGFVPPEPVLLNILTTDSKLVRLLQLADIVVGAVTAIIGGQDRYAIEPFEYIRPMLVTNAAGQIGGCGLKIAPDRLENLYYWLLGESEYSYAGGKKKIALPHRSRLFARDAYRP